MIEKSIKVDEDTYKAIRRLAKDQKRSIKTIVAIAFLSLKARLKEPSHVPGR